MSVVFLLIFFFGIAIAVGLGYLGYRALRKREKHDERDMQREREVQHERKEESEREVRHE